MIDRLLEVIDRLLAPDGCPCDREQTLRSWAHMVFEEICEVMDSLTEADSDQLADELGDVITGSFSSSRRLQAGEAFLFEAV